MCARRLNLPIVRPKWVFDSAANGGSMLLVLNSKYLSRVPLDENESPQQPTEPHAVIATAFMRQPLALLREAAERGELDSLDPTSFPPSTTTLRLCGQVYGLDVPTGLLRHHALMPLASGTGGDDPTSNASRAPSPPRAYTLRELLFAVRCASLSHADYFLQCVMHSVEPVLLLDKRQLLQQVLPPMSDATGGLTSTAEAYAASPSTASCDSASRLLEGPLCRVTLAALDQRATPLSHRDTAEDDASVTTTTPGVGASSESPSLLRELRDAAEDRVRLNAKVMSLSSQLQDERARTEAAATNVISAAATAGVAVQY